jgi:uncharacterized protein (UPF0332 family)
LDDADFLLHGNRLKAAANRAYYAMFHVAMAALVRVTLTLPKTHSGTISQFGRHYVRTGKLSIDFARDFRQAYNLRQDSDYGIFAEVGEARVKETVEKAKAFVAEVKRLVE